MSSDLNDLADQIEAIPDASPEQWATWTRIVTTHAPDLANMLGVNR